jgi:hypothetical protein
MDNGSNLGLAPGIDALENVYGNYTSTDGIEMNHADLYAYAGQVAAEYGMSRRCFFQKIFIFLQFFK